MKKFKQFDSNISIPILYGLILIKTGKNISTSNIDNKDKFLKIITNALKHKKSSFLPELQKWISLKLTPINDNIFFEIYNYVNNFTATELANIVTTLSIDSYSLRRQLHSNSDSNLNLLTITLLNLKPNDTFLDPTATINGPWFHILKHNPNQEMTLQTIDPLEASFIYLIVKAYDGKNTKIYSKNVLSEAKYVKKNELLKFDRIINLPPFGMHISSTLVNNSFNRFKYGKITSTNITWGFVSNSLSSLNDTGRAIVTVLNGDLFGSASRKKVRNNIISSDKIEAVINLPSGISPRTSLQTNLLILNNNKKLKNKIQFIDANQEKWLSRNGRQIQLNSTGIEEIKTLLQKPKSIINVSQIVDIDNCYETLMVNKYVKKDYISIDNREYHVNYQKLENLKTISLNDVTFIYGGYNVIRTKEISNSKFRILKISDLNDESINYSSLESINIQKNSNIKDSIIRQNDIVFSIRGTLGKCIFIEKKPSERTIISSNLVIIRPKNKNIDSKWLYIYLNSMLAKYFIQKDQSGSTVSLLPIKDLQKLRIPIISIQDQKRVIHCYEIRTHKIQSLQAKLNHEKEKLKNETNNLLGINDLIIPKDKLTYL